MKVLYDKIASVIPVTEHEIASATSLVAGQLVTLSGGLVAKASQTVAGALLGVCLETHSGVDDSFNPRSAGNRVKVADSPSAVYASPAPLLAASGGSTTTVVASTLGVFADGDFTGAKLKLIAKVADSTNTDPVGKVYEVTNYVQSTKTFTISTAGGAVTAGDTFLVFPPVGTRKGFLNASRDALAVAGGAAATLSLRVIGHELHTGDVLLVPALHEFGNDRA